MFRHYNKSNYLIIFRGERSFLRTKSYLPDVFSQENKQRCINQLNKMNNNKRRLGFLEKIKSKRRAAVLVCLCVVNNEESLLFTQRSFDMPTHKGQVR